MDRTAPKICLHVGIDMDYDKKQVYQKEVFVSTREKNPFTGASDNADLAQDPILDALRGPFVGMPPTVPRGLGLTDVLCAILTGRDCPPHIDINDTMGGFGIENGWQIQTFVVLCFLQTDILPSEQNRIIGAVCVAIGMNSDEDLCRAAAKLISKWGGIEAVRNAIRAAPSGSLQRANLSRLAQDTLIAPEQP